jgi:hypothetical protein
VAEHRTHDRGNQDDPELIAMDILSTEGPEVARGYHGRSQVGQVDAVTLAKAYLDTAAELRGLKESANG